MEALEIKIQINRALNQFLTLFTPEVSGHVRNNIYVAGGAVVNLVLGQPVVDYDIFIKTEPVRDLVKGQLDGLLMAPGFILKASTENAVTLMTPTNDILQVVTRFFGPPDRVFKTFDFEHCKAFYDPETDALVYNADVIATRELKYTGEKDEYTLNTLKRLVKFVNRGWKPTNDTIMNLHRAIQNRPHIDTPEENRKQTIGFYGSSMS